MTPIRGRTAIPALITALTLCALYAWLVWYGVTRLDWTTDTRDILKACGFIVGGLIAVIAIGVDAWWNKDANV